MRDNGEATFRKPHATVQPDPITLKPGRLALDCTCHYVKKPDTLVGRPPSNAPNRWIYWHSDELTLHFWMSRLTSCRLILRFRRSRRRTAGLFV